MTITATWVADGDTYSLPLTGAAHRSTDAELRYWVAAYADDYGIPFDAATLTLSRTVDDVCQYCNDGADWRECTHL